MRIQATKSLHRHNLFCSGSHSCLGVHMASDLKIDIKCRGKASCNHISEIGPESSIYCTQQLTWAASCAHISQTVKGGALFDCKGKQTCKGNTYNCPDATGCHPYLYHYLYLYLYLYLYPNPTVPMLQAAKSRVTVITCCA